MPRTKDNKLLDSGNDDSDSQHLKGHVRYVPYAVGFRQPSRKRQLEAAGFKGNTIPNEYGLGCQKDGFTFFKSIPQPSSIDDWLAQYNEEGQTYKQYLRENPWFSARKLKYLCQKFVPGGQSLTQKYPEGKIYIVPVGDFDTSCGVNFEDLLDYARQFLCLPVATLQGLKLDFKDGQIYLKVDPNDRPKFQQGRTRTSNRVVWHTLHTRYNSKTKHIQIRVDSILPKLRERIPQDALCMIGLTMHDLYGDNTDLFVAGMAAGNQRVAIFSLKRYDPSLTFSKEFWYDIWHTEDVDPESRESLVLQRSCKLVVHEICHLLGIDHCIFFDCCMNGSGHLAEDFRQPMHLCPVDLHKLQTLVQFDVVERYKNLLSFYTRHKLTEELNWVARRLTFIQRGKGSKELTEDGI